MRFIHNLHTGHHPQITALSIITPYKNQIFPINGDDNTMVVSKKAEPKKTEAKMNATKPAVKPVVKSVPKSKK